MNSSSLLEVGIALAITFMIIGVYLFLPSRNKKKIVEDDNSNIPSTVEEFSRNKRAEDYLGKFIDNSKDDIRVIEGSNDMHSKAVMSSIRKSYDSYRFEIRDNEVGITEKEYDFLVRNFQNTNYSWLAPAALAITDEGKLRIPFSSIQYMVSRLNPVMLPDGTMKVLNLLTLDESINLTLMKGIPMFVKNQKDGVVKTFTKEMIQDRVVDKSLDEILNSANLVNELNNKLEEQKPKIKRYEKEIIAYKKNDEKLLELSIKFTEQKDKLKFQRGSLEKVEKELQKEKNITEEQQREIQRLTQQLNQKNADFSQLESDAITTAQKNNNESCMEITKEGQQSMTDDKEANVEVVKPQQSLKKRYSKGAFIEIIEEYLFETDKNKNKILTSIGFLCVAKKINSNDLIAIFNGVEFTNYISEWKKDKNCEENTFSIKANRYYIFHDMSPKAITGEFCIVYLKNKNIATTTDDYVISETMLNGDSKSVALGLLRDMVAKNELSEYGEDNV